MFVVPHCPLARIVPGPCGRLGLKTLPIITVWDLPGRTCGERGKGGLGDLLRPGLTVSRSLLRNTGYDGYNGCTSSRAPWPRKLDPALRISHGPTPLGDTEPKKAAQVLRSRSFSCSNPGAY